MGRKLETLRSLLYEMDTDKKNVFQQTPEPLSLEEKRAFVEGLNSFSTMAERLRARGEQLKEAVEQITNMVETSQRYVSESESDMVDMVEYSRRSKYLKEALKELQKSANEVMIHERRMEAACEDIREGLSKYYRVG